MCCIMLQLPTVCEYQPCTMSAFRLYLNPALNVGSPFHLFSQTSEPRRQRMRLRTVLFIISILMIPRVVTVQAQVTTGNIIGTVRDESGAVLAGVTASLASPSLPGGPQSTVTNEQGQYRFTRLQPGTYELKVEQPGFNI